MPYVNLLARGFNSAGWGVAEQKLPLEALNKKCISASPSF